MTQLLTCFTVSSDPAGVALPSTRPLAGAIFLIDAKLPEGVQR